MRRWWAEAHPTLAVNVNHSLSVMIAAARGESIEDDNASAAFEAMRQQLNRTT